MQATLHDGTGHICTVGGIVTKVIVIKDKVLDPLLFLSFSLSLRLHRNCKTGVRRKLNRACLSSVSD